MLIVGLLAASALITTLYAASTERSNEGRRNDESIRNVHQSVALTLEETDAKIRDFTDKALADRKQLLKDLTNAQLGAMASLDASVRSGAVTLTSAQEAASQTLYDFRYGSDDYFFAFTPDMVSIVEPNPTFRGNMLDYRDPNGKAFFREFQQVALGPGSGYVDYVGTRVGESVPAPKISYIAYFAPWQWVIGTGVYLDDIDAAAVAQFRAATAELSGSLERVRFADEGFFFVLEREGGVLAGPVSRSLEQLGAGGSDADLVDRLLAVAPDDGTIVSLDADARLGGREQRWYFDVSSVGSKRWVLVSAVPKRVLVEAANELAVRQVLLAGLVLVLGLALGLTASRRIIRPVRQVTSAASALENDEFDPTSLDAAAGRRDEVGVLARTFRRMAAEVVERERALRDRVRRLEVVIDQKKVAEEINTIVETDFFRRLEAKADSLRRSDDATGHPGT